MQKTGNLGDGKLFILSVDEAYPGAALANAKPRFCIKLEWPTFHLKPNAVGVVEDLITANLKSVRARIGKAALRSGRNPENVRLVAVSKTVDEIRVSEAMEAGVVDFGENKVQEARIKIPQFKRRDVRWHMIGHLQKNKVKYVFDLFDEVHSVDDLELAEAIHHGALKRDLVVPVLVQVNIAREAVKHGADPKRLESMLTELSRLDGIRVEGLMTMIPYDPDPEQSRPHFARLRELRDRMELKGIEGVIMRELSMGMSHDFHIAVEEGATLVRVGTGIFG